MIKALHIGKNHVRKTVHKVTEGRIGIFSFISDLHDAQIERDILG